MAEHDIPWWQRFTFGTPPPTIRELREGDNTLEGKVSRFADRVGFFFEQGITYPGIPSDFVDDRDPDATGGYEASTGRTGGRMTPEQRAIVSAYWDRMNNLTDENGNLSDFYWDIQFGEQDEDGTYPVIGVRPSLNAAWSIDRDSEQAGWTERMLAWVINRLHAGPISINDRGDPLEGLTEVYTGPGGGGARGPVYVAPMREVVEDTVKALLTALTGDEPEERIQELTDIYLKADRERWDVARSTTGGEDINPNQVVLIAIREQDDYKRIHTLRAEGDSETRWISDRQTRLTQLGLTSADADDRAVWLAQTGTNLNDIDTGAFQITRGMNDITLMGKIQKAASLVAGQL